jgi:phosphomannomutase/phosphoglucomutase
LETPIAAATEPRKLFGTNGIRGVPGRDLMLDFISEIGQSIGTYFGNGVILVGHDVRASSPTISKIIVSGLLASGANVADAGLAPTPALQFAVKKLGYRGGVIVTASHNPPQYNGIKVVGPDGVEISRDEELAVERIFFEKRYNRANWRNVGNFLPETRVLANYEAGIISHIDTSVIKNKTFKVVLDIGNGAQSVAAPYILENLGCKVTTINGHPDGDFPGRGPEPTPDVLRALSDTVKVVGADLGVAYDGDGDRSIFCDETGEVHWGDKSGSILLDYLCSSKPGAVIVTTVSTTQIVDIIAKRYNCKVIRTKVGSVDVSRAMVINTAEFGLEENGGFFFGPHIPVRDGAMTTALMLNALASKNRKFSDCFHSLPPFFQRKGKFECPNEKKKEVMKRIADHAKGDIEAIDGYKIWTDEKTWILLRPSGTEPLIRVFAESNERDKLDSVFQKYREIVSEAIGDVKSQSSLFPAVHS